MRLTIVLRVDVGSTAEAQQKVDRVKEALANFPEVNITAQTNDKLEPPEPE